MGRQRHYGFPLWLGPIRESLIGMVGSKNAAAREKWLVKMRALGAEVR